MQLLGFTLQFLALVVVGSALLIGLGYESMQTELSLLMIGAVVFFLGRWLQKRGA